MSLLDEITMEELDAEQQQIAECIGIEAYKKLVKNYAGSCIYICKPDTLTVNRRNEEIRKKFNGYNYGELAREFNLAEVSIRRIVAPVLIAVKAAPLPEQTTFFDEDTEI